MEIQKYKDVLEANGNDLDNLRGQCFKYMYFENVEDLADITSVGGIVLESPILMFDISGESVFEKPVFQINDAIFRNAISTYGQVIDFRNQTNLNINVIHKLPWKNSEFLNFDAAHIKKMLSKKLSRVRFIAAFFGDFESCSFDNIEFGLRYQTDNLKMTDCVIKDSSFNQMNISGAWIDESVIQDTHFDACRVTQFGFAMDCLFDKKYFYNIAPNSIMQLAFKDKYVTPGYKVTEIYNCHFDRLQIKRGKNNWGEYNPNRDLRLRFPYKGLETCSFSVYLLSEETDGYSDRWIKNAKEKVPFQLKDSKAYNEQDIPKYSSFIEFCDENDLWYLMGFLKEDLLRAKKLTYVLNTNLYSLHINVPSHKEKEVLNLEFFGGHSMERCEFKNIELNIVKETSEKVIMYKCTFENCIINVEETVWNNVELMNCRFINCVIKGMSISVNSTVNETLFKDCEFESVDLTLNYHPNVIVESTVTYDKNSKLGFRFEHTPTTIKKLGFTPK